MSNKYEVYLKSGCPFGIKALKLLKIKEFSYVAHMLEDEDKVQAIKERYGVATTPLVLKEGRKVGGYSDLAKSLGVEADVGDQSYWPIIAVLGVAVATGVTLNQGVHGVMGVFLALLATLKLMDLNAFVIGFRKYDLLSKRFVLYGYIYPFLELGIAMGILSMKIPIITGAVSVALGILGSIAVFKAVYLEKLDLNCACVGGSNKVPLGIISFLENVAMILMGILLLFSI
jgi:glutaredoxin